MRNKTLSAMALCALLMVPALALANSTTYEGEGRSDPRAKVELKITNGDDREVKKVIAKKLKYLSGAFCVDTGRTGEIVVRDNWRVKGNGEFRVIGQFDGGGDPLAGGELKVVGDATRNKVTGKMKFTYGKTGCQTEKLEFKATR